VTIQRRFRCAASDPPDVEKATTAERWFGDDRGIMVSWVVGLSMGKRHPELAEAARRGELPILPWKGGVDKPVKRKKFGALHYLAMWQGLRGDDLDIDVEREVQMTCTRFGATVTFTGDQTKYSGE
jgi:hypothetical protein